MNTVDENFKDHVVFLVKAHNEVVTIIDIKSITKISFEIPKPEWNIPNKFNSIGLNNDKGIDIKVTTVINANR